MVDEADTLFDPSFEEATTSILNSLPIRSKKKVPQLSGSDRETQVTIVGATLSTNMLTKIEKLVPVSLPPPHISTMKIDIQYVYIHVEHQKGLN